MVIVNIVERVRPRCDLLLGVGIPAVELEEPRVVHKSVVVKLARHIVDRRVVRNGHGHGAVRLRQRQNVVRAGPRADRQQYRHRQHTADVEQNAQSGRKARLILLHRLFLLCLFVYGQICVFLRKRGLKAREGVLRSQLLRLAIRRAALGGLGSFILFQLFLCAFQQVVQRHITEIDLVLRFVELKVVKIWHSILRSPPQRL